MTKYDILIIDPPWKQTKGGLRSVRPNQGKNLDYQTMKTDDIFSLLDKEIFPMAMEQHIVFIWTIDRFLFDCEKKMVERGYKRHAIFIWDKTNGIAPAFSVRYSHEYLIWYYKPRFTPIVKNMRGVYRTVFVEPSREHSRKPDCSYSMIKQMYPSASIIDVFSREKREGISQWGNEVNCFFENTMRRSEI